MREVEELVHLNIGYAIEEDEEGKAQFVLKVGKARGPGGRDIQNSTLPFISFADFASLVFPQSHESDWV